MKIVSYDFKSNGNGMRPIHRGPIRFTCPECGQESHIDLDRMIFRNIEFYCECGKPFRMTNPAFVNDKNIGKTPRR